MEFLIGIFVGGLLYWLFFDRIKPSGTFVIDMSDPMKDLCTFELEESLNSIIGKKSIKLKIKCIDDNSQ